MSIQTDNFTEQRIIDAAPASPNEEAIERALRPKHLDDYVGQSKIRDQLETLPAQAGKETGFGRRFEVSVPITGPNGRKGTLFTVWQFDQGSTTPRMITNLLKVHQ